MWKRVLLFVIISILFIYTLTQVFEYCINEASDTTLTLFGVLLVIILCFFYGYYLYKNVKILFKK